MKHLTLFILLLTSYSTRAQVGDYSKELFSGNVNAKILSYKKIEHLYLFQLEYDDGIVVGYTIIRNDDTMDCNEIIVGKTYPLEFCYEFPDVYPYTAINLKIEGVLITMEMRKSGPLYRILNLSGLCLTE